MSGPARLVAGVLAALSPNRLRRILRPMGYFCCAAKVAGTPKLGGCGKFAVQLIIREWQK